jgi:UDP-glucose 4-epimerase
MISTLPITLRPHRTLLVIGGCGYIGSHMVKCLLDAGHRVVVLDDLSGGYRDALLGGELVVGDFGERTVLDALFEGRRFDGVLHFASLIQVGESVRDPALYYRSNMAKVLTLLEAMRDHQVPALVFSSSAAVYGEPHYVPIDESHPCTPINPYGMTKHVVETMLRDFAVAYGLRAVALRYFNAAGADPLGRLGERHQPETHLIPLAMQAALGTRPALQVFGRDYDTPDGTCIRDYVHVDDLADAHLLALEYLWSAGPSTSFNLGNGAGFSVQQVIDTVAAVSGVPVPVEEGARRAGDPARLVADAARARQVLGWTPRYGDLETIVRHAWRWEQLRPDARAATRRYGNEQAT